jgi:hypothetical protein
VKITIANRWTDAEIFSIDEDEATVLSAMSAWMKSMGPLASYIFAACRVSDDGCLEWQLSTTRGRGRVTVAGKRMYAHRAFWELAMGQVPEGLMVLHGCDNPLCVNPAHMFLGTHQDNMRDMVLKGRSTKGTVLSAERRLAIGNSLRGRHHSMETRAAIADGVRKFRAQHAAAKAKVQS